MTNESNCSITERLAKSEGIYGMDGRLYKPRPSQGDTLWNLLISVATRAGKPLEEVIAEAAEAIEESTFGAALLCGLEFAPIVYGVAETSSGDRYACCAECGNWASVDYGVVIDDEFYCDELCAEQAGWERCAHCGEWTNTEHGDGIDTDRGAFCSPECANRADVYRCEDCGDWHALADLYTTHDDDLICENCYDEHYTRCCDCYNIYHVDEVHADGEGDYYCDDCWPGYAVSDNLHAYGYTPRIVFYGERSQGPYLGVELETDKGSDRNDYVDKLCELDEAHRIWMTQDSSLDEGVEVTSMPMTISEHVGCGIWEDVRETAVAYGFRSHDARTCGLHIHVNRDFFAKSPRVQDACAYKLTRLLTRFEQPLTVFSRRESNRWCEYKTYEDYGRACAKKRGLLQKSLELKQNEEYKHSKALNLQHANTLEFRIFRGTLKLETLYASMALVVGLSKLVKRRGESYIEAVTWYDLARDVLAVLEGGDEREQHARACLQDYLAVKGLL